MLYSLTHRHISFAKDTESHEEDPNQFFETQLKNAEWSIAVCELLAAHPLYQLHL